MTQGSVHSVVVRLGIIGFPGSGKTTLFNLLTGAEAGVDQPPGRGRLNVGVVRVPDDRVTRLSALFQPKKTVYATVDVVDLAGFDRGERATLDVGDLRQADALLHVVRAFPSPSLVIDKYWPPVGRIDAAAGDRNLVCSCPPIEDYQQAAE